MAKPKVLETNEIDAALTNLPDWKRDGHAIAAAYKFASFRNALAFIVRVGFEAEELNHHPEIVNEYNKVSFKLSTHDAGGTTTERDIALATRISAVAPPFLAAR
jgi:4a-hydroxytetrahydrobiopterin dehydratase